MIQMPRKHIFLIALLLFIISLSSASEADDLLLDENASNLSLSGAAFLDENKDSFLSDNETGIANVTVRLMKDDAEIASALTDERGSYIFADLDAGIYKLRADPMAGSNQTAPGGGFYEVNLSDMPGYGLDFGFFVPGSLTAAGPLPEYPIMRPTAEEMGLWSSQYNSSPRAVVSPEVAAMMADEPPDSCNLLGMLEYTPSERDQGRCGNCWAWAGTGVMEIDYARQKGVSDRFSIQFLDSNYNGGCGSKGACCGGWLDNLANFYTAKKMIVPWSNANALYKDGTKSCGSCAAVSASKISTNPNYKLSSISTSTIETHGLTQEQAINNIKSVLVQEKAIWFGFFLPESSSWNNFYDFWGSKSESEIWNPDLACGRAYSYQSGGGHAVLCVGYVDNGPGDRYWIMLNSWGTTNGRPNGLFRVNMSMDYDCTYPGPGYAFYWMTLDMTYPGPNSAPQIPTVPKGVTQGSVSRSYSYAATSSDVDGDPISFTFNWGDSSTTTTSLTTTGKGTASHTWRAAGTYAVTAIAADSNGAISAQSQPLSVTITSRVNSPPSTPSKPAGISSGFVGRSYSFVGYASDPNRDQITYIFDWGDGEMDQTDPMASGLSARLSHTWEEPGVYQVRIKAEDNNGDESAWSMQKAVQIKSAASMATSEQPDSLSRESEDKVCACKKND